MGNAASKSHAFGWKAEEAVEAARADVAALIGASPKEIVWTSGATESDNLAIKGVAQFYGETKGKHLVTAKTEHKAVLDSMHALERQGFEVTFLDVGADGTGRADFVARGASLEAGPGSLFPEGGTSVVLHAAPDDLRTDPAGTAGARIACGVVERR